MFLFFQNSIKEMERWAETMNKKKDTTIKKAPTAAPTQTSLKPSTSETLSNFKETTIELPPSKTVESFESSKKVYKHTITIYESLVYLWLLPNDK